MICKKCENSNDYHRDGRYIEVNYIEVDLLYKLYRISDNLLILRNKKVEAQHSSEAILLNTIE